MKTIQELAALTAEQRKAPYASFYDRPAPRLAPECAQVLAHGSNMDPADVVNDRNIQVMLHPRQIAVENGYCVLPDGTGYVAARHVMPEVTFDMYQFWLDWWTAEDQETRYKIWCPGKHIGAFYTYSSELIGDKLEEIYFGTNFRHNPGLINIDVTEMRASTCVMADGGNAISKVYGAPPEEPPVCGTVCHFIYVEPGVPGITMRSRFWFGCQALNGHIVPVLAPGQRISKEYLHSLYEHNCLEMSGLRDLLPELYRQQVANRR